METHTVREHLREFVTRHKVAITATTTAVVTTTLCVMASRVADKQMREFIKEHNLWDEYLTPKQ
jgi:hypothetical protein